jgi:hypothetical protein
LLTLLVLVLLFEVDVCVFDDEFIILVFLFLLVVALYFFCGLLEFVVERTAAGLSLLLRAVTLLLRSGDAKVGAVSVAAAALFAFAKRRRLFAAGLFDTMSERVCDCDCDFDFDCTCSDSVLVDDLDDVDDVFVDVCCVLPESSAIIMHWNGKRSVQ